MKRRQGGPLAATLAAALTLTPALVGCGARGEKTAAADGATRPVSVTLAGVTTRPIERTVDAVGTLKGWDEVTIGAKRVGRVSRVLHDIGDRVRPGELLVECERDDAQLAVSQAEKQLLSDLAMLGLNMMTIPRDLPDLRGIDVAALPAVVEASVALDRSRNNLNRERNLMNKGAGTMQELQNNENDVRAAEARLASAILNAKSTVAATLSTKVMLEIRRQALRDMEVRVPVPTNPPVGLKEPLTFAVAKRNVSEGQMVREGDAMFNLAVENPLRLWVNVPERHAAEIKLGQEVRVRVGSYPDEVFPATVSRINPTVATDSRSFQVEANVPNDANKLRPGGFAKAEIVTDRDAKSTVVPLDAIVRYAGVTKLFTVGPEDRAHAVAIETGREGAGWVEVLTPLPAGTRVVTTGQSRLADETPVAVRTPEAEAPAPRTTPTPPPGPQAKGM